MLVGHVGRIESDVVGGWAADTDAVDDVVDVLIYVDGKRAARVCCDRFREDLRDLGIYGDGRHGFEYRISPPLPIHLLDRITVRFAGSGAILPDGERVTRHEGSMGAILVTAPGRSGTTLLMSRLASSPQICVAEAHPFEVRLISYWATAVRILAGEPDYERSMHPDRLEGDGFKVGANPFSHKDYADAFRTRVLKSEYFSTYVPNQLRDFALKIIEEYYQRVKDDCQKHSALFLAEKNNNLDRSTRAFASSLFPGLKEIVLIRDPRDLLCSQLAYFRSTVNEVTAQITEAAAELVRMKREEADRLLFVRYEDLVMDSGQTLAFVADRLGIELPTEVNNATEESRFKAHGTSKSPEASIGRWKAQLSREEKSLFNANWQRLMEEFGYS